MLGSVERQEETTDGPVASEELQCQAGTGQEDRPTSAYTPTDGTAPVETETRKAESTRERHSERYSLLGKTRAPASLFELKLGSSFL